MLWLVLGCWLAAVLPLAAAPAVSARLDTTQVRVGDPVHLELRLQYPKGSTPVLPGLPALLPAFSVRPEAPGPAQAAGEELREVRRYELRCFQLGPQQIPSLQLGFVQGGDTLKVDSAPLQLEVVPVRQAGDEELRDIKAPVSLGDGFPAWAWGIAGALAAVALAAAIYWWRQRRQRLTPPPPPPPPKDHLAEFARIGAMGLLERGGTKIYYSLLAETLRHFIEDNMGLEAMERTTAEITLSLGQAHCETALAAQIERFLGTADLVKFARFAPSQEEARQAPEAGMAIVRRVLELKAKEQEALAARKALERAEPAPTS